MCELKEQLPVRIFSISTGISLFFFQIIRDCLESYRGSRSEPAGLCMCRLRKQATEAEGGPLEFRKVYSKGRFEWVCSEERESMTPEVLSLEDFKV